MKSNINWVFLIFGIFLVLSCSKKNKRIVSPSPYDVELNQSKMEGNLINEKSTKNISEISVLYSPKSWKAYWELTPTEVAVFESHRLLWEKCVKTNVPFLICEDDIGRETRAIRAARDVKLRELREMEQTLKNAGLII